MKGIIKKILLEQVSESDHVILSEKELKLIVFILKNKTSFNYSEKSFFSKQQITLLLREAKEFLTNDLLIKFFFLLVFNTPKDLFRSLKNKDISNLYLGPFYISLLNYNLDEWEEDHVDQYEDCEYCGGSGEETDTCSSCSGAGYHEEEEDDDFLEYECDNCGGSGEESITCGYCGGSGEETYYKTVYRLQEAEELIITKNGLDENDIESTYESTIENIFDKRNEYFVPYVTENIDELVYEPMYSDKLPEKYKLKADQIIDYESKHEKIPPNKSMNNLVINKILGL